MLEWKCTNPVIDLWSSIPKLNHLAELPVKLIPIRLEIESEYFKLKDTFTWNLNGQLFLLALGFAVGAIYQSEVTHLGWQWLETLVTPEMFAQMLVDDYESPQANNYVAEIADQIRKQVEEYAVAMEEDPMGDGTSRVVDDEGLENQDVRIIIKVKQTY